MIARETAHSECTHHGAHTVRYTRHTVTRLYGYAHMCHMCTPRGAEAWDGAARSNPVVGEGLKADIG